MLLRIQPDRMRALQRQGFSLALEWKKDGGPKRWPDDPPEHKNRLVVVPADTRQSQELFVTSTRGITIAPLEGSTRGFGIVCAGDGRGRNQYVLGGGKVQPDFDTQNMDRLPEDAKFGIDRELVRGAMVAENREELCIQHAESDTDAYGRYFMYGVRYITDRIGEETNFVTQEGLPCADAYFVTITRSQLGYFGGQRGETRARFVRKASDLLRGLTHEERERNVLPILPTAHAVALSMCIRVLPEIFGSDLPPELADVVQDGGEQADNVWKRARFYTNHTLKVFQECPWEA